MKLGKYIPQKIKKPFIQLQYVPEKTMLKLYYAAANGKLYVPDKLFQKWDYKINCGKKLNLKNPVTFQDKLQWMKLYYRRPDFTQMVDKYGAREWVAKKIGEQYLVPIYGVYNSFDEINFDEFPNEFVLKCTHDSGSVVICRDKSHFDYDKAKEVLEKGLKREQFYLSREWPYKNVPHRIICEKYLKDDIIDDAPDYKFFCFDGEVKFLLVNSERNSLSGCKTDFYWTDFTHIEMKELEYENNPKGNKRPEKLNEMITLAGILSKDIPHVRVDFYLINDQIYFGEMTFFHCGGRKPFVPDEYNTIFGEYINLPKKYKGG